MSKLMDRVISVEYAIKDDDNRRNANSPNGGRDTSPRRRSDDRGRSPSPYRRERGSPDYGRGRDRGSPDYGRGRSRSPCPQRRGGRGSPDYGRASPVLNGKERSTSPNGKVRNADYRPDASPHPRRERERSPPPRHGRGSISKERERISPEYEQGAIVSPRSEGQITKLVRGDSGICLTNMPVEESQRIFNEYEDYNFARTGSIATETVGGMPVLNFSSLVIFSAFVRVLLIIYGEWQDTHMEVRYTDVDYLVFSDAAALVFSGKSPYKRSTYRYSPLIAFLLTPNSFIHRSWGKFLFSASDLLVGYFIRTILKLRGVPENLTIYSVIVWLFNPFTFTIGTRGNCEPIICAIILWIIICLMRGNLFQGAVWYGLVVHMRIYPIIYALPIIIILDPYHFQPGKKPSIIDWNSRQPKSNTCSGPTKKFNLNRLWVIFASLFTRSRILFGLISATIFFFFTGIFFYLYEWEFLHEALLYHLTRTDPRHNFSIYFYHIYLNYKREFSVLEKLVSFLPQLIVQIVLISRFAQDFPFCFFLQTVAFVAFNKVITAQYFVWFFCLLPLILPWSKMKLKWEGILCILLWMGAQTHWLFWGYMLEFKGKQVFLQLWAASLLFFAANTYVMITIILRHTYSPVFKHVVTSRSLKTM